MKICLITDKYPPDVGGLAVSVQRHARFLADAGHAVHVIVPDEQSALGSWRTEQVGLITIHRFGANDRPRQVLTEWFDRAVELDLTLDFDLFHGYFLAYAGYIAAYLGRYRAKPAIVSARGNDIDVTPFDDRRAGFMFKALAWANAVTAVTTEMARKTAALSGRADIQVIHNGVDADLFQPQPASAELQAQLGLDDRPILGFIGEARAKKGLARLLRLYAQLAESRPVQLLLVGGVRAADQQLVDFFHRHHPQFSVRLVPAQPHHEMPPYYALCTVIVLPSLRDGLPNTLLEAMACGRAVVASAVGGMPDVISTGHDGLLLSPRDEPGWMVALDQLLVDPALRTRLGAAARQTILERFTPAREGTALLALYERLLAEAIGDTA